MARRNEHSKDELREKAIAAAEAIVIKDGYRSLNARRVAAEMDYTAGTLYLLFKNFDELIMHVNGRTLDVLHTELARTHAADGSVEALAVAYIRFVHQHRQRWKLLYEYHPSGDIIRPDWYREKLERLFALVETALQGEKSDIPPTQRRIAATALWGAIHGICTLELDERLHLSVDRSAEEIARFMVKRFLHH
jgi:AcrR family transcriptional regulator